MRAWIVLLIFFFILVSVGCVTKGPSTPTPPLYFVEAHLKVDTEIVNLPQKEYGIITGHKAILSFTASKHISQLNGTMTMEINLPKDVEYVSGDTEWRGNDQSKTMEVRVKAAKKGKWLINGTAINLENNRFNNRQITVYVADNIDEMKKMGFGEEGTEKSSAVILKATTIVNSSAATG